MVQDKPALLSTEWFSLGGIVSHLSPILYTALQNNHELFVRGCMRFSASANSLVELF